MILIASILATTVIDTSQGSVSSFDLSEHTGNVIIQGDNSFTLSEQSTLASIRVKSSATFHQDFSTVQSGFIEQGGCWRGNGTVLQVLVNQGTVKPGSGIGKIDIAGSFVATGTTMTELQSPGGKPLNDLYRVTGSATLSGSLLIQDDPGQVYLNGERFRFLTAQGGIFGVFDNSSLVNGVLLPYSIEYNPYDVQIVLLQNSVGSSNRQLSGNVGREQIYLQNLEGIQPTNPLVVFLTAIQPFEDQLPSALAAFSPARNASSLFAGFITTSTFLDAMEMHAEEMRVFRPKRFFAHQSSKDELFTQNMQVKRSKYTVLAIEPEQDWCAFWARGIGTYFRQSRQDQIPTVYGSIWGTVVGFDFYSCGNSFATIGLGYARSGWDFAENLGSGQINHCTATIMGAGEWRNFFFDLGVYGAYDTIRQKRRITLSGFQQTIASQPHIWQVVPYMGFYYDGLVNSTSALEPFGTVSCDILFASSYREHGPPSIAWFVKKNTSYVLLSTAGLRVYKRIEIYGRDLFLKGSLAYVNKIFFGLGQVNAILTGFPDSTTVDFLSFHRTQRLFNPSFGFFSRPQDGFFFIGGEYDGQFGMGYIQHEGQMTVGVYF